MVFLEIWSKFTKFWGKFMDFQSCSPSISHRISNVVHGGCVDIFWNSSLKVAGDIYRLQSRLQRVVVSKDLCNRCKK